MRAFLVILVIFAIASILIAQEKNQDKIYLKNGKVIIGNIIERIPDKAVVIETSSGTEIIDNDEIKKIGKYNPAISNIEPAFGAAGTTVKISGTDFGSTPNVNGVRFGVTYATVNVWTDNEITVTVPSSIKPGSYEVSVLVDNETLKSPLNFEVRAGQFNTEVRSRQMNKAAEPVQQKVEETEEEGISSFGMHFGYAKPQKELAETNGSGRLSSTSAGFAKPGFELGWEARIGLSSELYIPLNLQLVYLAFNKDEFKNSSSGDPTVTGAYLFMPVTAGLGLALHLSPTSYLFFSGEYGGVLASVPKITWQTRSGEVYEEAKEKFSSGYGFSAGLTIDNSVTFGYTVFNAKPKYSFTNSSSSGPNTSSIDFEKPVSIALMYLGIAF